MKAMSWPDGKILWESQAFKLANGGSFVTLPGGRAIMQSERGRVALASLDPRGLKIISDFKAVDGTETWATPLIYGGRLYAKGTQELICYDLSASK